jgi:hypothetical protein
VKRYGGGRVRVVASAGYEALHALLLAAPAR